MITESGTQLEYIEKRKRSKIETRVRQI